MNPTLGRYLDTGPQDSSGTIYAREARDGACFPGHMADHWQPRDHTSSSTSPSTQITSRFLSLGLPCKMGVGRLLSLQGGQCLARRDKFLSSLPNRHVGEMSSSDDTCTRLWHSPFSPSPVPMWNQGLVHGNTPQRSVALGPGPLPLIPGQASGENPGVLGEEGNWSECSNIFKAMQPPEHNLNFRWHLIHQRDDFWWGGGM